MACRAAVITGEVPVIPEDLVVPGKHYIVVKNPSDLGDAISETLVDGRWDAMAETGYNIIKAAHTWAVRAQQLRSLIHERLAL
jgi:glycosyltransferase involved in cell wall biosynthesis